MIFVSVYLFLIETLSFFIPPIGKIGTLNWIIIWLIILLRSIFLFAKIIPELFRKKLFFTLLLSVLTVVYIIVTIQSPKNLSGELTQEISCILKHLKESPDLGYHKTCFLGYPARQFIVPAVPSFFVKNQFSLNFGGSIYFIIGLLYFISGSFALFRLTKLSDLVTATLVALLFNYPFFIFLFSNFEQSFYPVSISLLIVGVLLNFKVKKNKIDLFILLFLSTFLVQSYTTSLAVWFLLLCTIFYLAVKSKFNRKTILLIMISLPTSIISFLISLTYRQDLRFQNSTSLNANTITSTISQLTQYFIHGDSLYPFGTPIFYFFIFLTLFLIIYANKKHLLFVFFWSLAVIFISALSPGYASPPIPFSLHRSAIIIPFIFLIFILAFNKLSFKSQIKKIITTIIVFICISLSTFFGIRTIDSIYKTKSRDIHMPIIILLKKQFSYHITDISISNQDDIISSLDDKAKYFLPNLNIVGSKIDSSDKITEPGYYLLKNDQILGVSSTNLLSSPKSTYSIIFKKN